MDRCKRQLTLLGIIHTDPEGMRRLYRAVTSLQPAAMTFELQEGFVYGFPPDKREQLVGWATTLLSLEEEQSEELEGLLKNYGYEWKVANGLEILQKKIYEIEFLEDNPSIKSNISRKSSAEGENLVIFSEKEDMLKEETEYYRLIRAIYPLFGFLSNPEEQEVVAICSAYVFFTPEDRQKIINCQYDKGPSRYTVQPRSSLLLRDQKMEERIREIWTNEDGDLLHVGGLSHVYGNYENNYNLYERLQDLNPVRRKLNEF